MFDFSILERTVGPLHFRRPLIIGAGTCKTLADVKKAVRTEAGGIELGSISLHAKPGNEGRVFYAHFEQGVLMYTLNSLGLPNPGKDDVATWAKEAIRLAHGAGMQIGINVVGDTLEELIEMVLWAIDLGFDWVTINGGCPNKYDKDKKPLKILANEQFQVAELCYQLAERGVCDAPCEIWWKGTPTTDTVDFLPSFGRMLGQAKIVNGIIVNNTVPHCFSWGEDGKPTIDPGGGLGGMGGPAVRAFAQGCVRILGPLLRQDQYIVGSGGVQFGQDLGGYLRLGARLAQTTSSIWAAGMNYGEANRILAEFMELPDLRELMAA